MKAVPTIRVRDANDRPIEPGGKYVLYWMIANRRVRWNFALQRAAELAGKLEKPLLIFEPLRRDYPWASERFDQFIVDGMRDNRAALAGKGVLHCTTWPVVRLCLTSLRQTITLRGLLSPLTDVPVDLFLQELQARGITIQRYEEDW